MMLSSDPNLVAQLAAERRTRDLRQSDRARLRRFGRRSHTRFPGGRGS
jgi:hypothetical protein